MRVRARARVSVLREAAEVRSVGMDWDWDHLSGSPQLKVVEKKPEDEERG